MGQTILDVSEIPTLLSSDIQHGNCRVGVDIGSLLTKEVSDEKDTRISSGWIVHDVCVRDQLGRYGEECHAFKGNNGIEGRTACQ